MDPTLIATEADLDAVRTRRVQLRQALRELEEALAAPASGRAEQWGQRVHAAFVRVADEFSGHIAVTEGPGGLHQTVLAAAVRLANAVAGLAADHDRIAAEIAGLVADTSVPLAGEQIDGIRERATALLAALARHRQRGADLIYEAYQTDIGGCD
jgi:hypothetical protein